MGAPASAFDDRETGHRVIVFQFARQPELRADRIVNRHQGHKCAARAEVASRIRCVVVKILDPGISRVRRQQRGVGPTGSIRLSCDKDDINLRSRQLKSREQGDQDRFQEDWAHEGGHQFARIPLNFVASGAKSPAVNLIHVAGAGATNNNTCKAAQTNGAIASNLREGFGNVFMPL